MSISPRLILVVTQTFMEGPEENQRIYERESGVVEANSPEGGGSGRYPPKKLKFQTLNSEVYLHHQLAYK